MVSAVFSRIRSAAVKWRVVIALVLVVAIGLSSCNPDHFRTQAAQVPRIVMSSLNDPKTFNTILSQESNDVFGYIYEGLLSTNGLTGELEPGLAESWKISPDQRTITYKLREGLKWSNGEPLTVDDVVFTYNEIIFNDDIPSSESDIFRIGEQGLFPTVKKVDDRQVEFTSPEPFAPLLRFAGGNFLPKHALQESVHTKGADGKLLFLSTWGTDTDPKKIVGNGPYRIRSYQPGERIVLERNPYYWRKDAQGRQQPYIEQIVLQIVESDDASLMQFRSGGLDIEGITPDYFSLVKQEEKRGHFKIYNGGPALSSQFLVFNLNQGKRNGKPVIDPAKSGWFNSLEFRKAIAHAIDRPTMINAIYQGLGVPQNSPIYIQSPYYFPPEKGLLTYGYAPTKAKELLLGAGFKYSSKGELLDSEGNRVRFTLITNAGNKIREAMGAQIKRDLSKMGIQVDFQPINFNTLVKKTSNTLDWEALILGFSGAGIEPDGGRNVWSPTGHLHLFNQGAGKGQAPLEGRKISDWEAEIGRLYIQGGQELIDEKRKQIYAKAQILVQENVPLVFLINPLSLSAVHNKIEGVKFSALGGALWNVEDLKLSKK